METNTTDRTVTSTQTPAMASVNSGIARPLFKGDKNPKQFWNNVEEYLEGCKESVKCKRVARLWGMDLAVEAWYEGLEPSMKSSWEALAAVFDAKWNKRAKHTLSDANLLAILQRDTPTDQQMIKLTTMNDKPVPKLFSWWRTTNNLVLTHRIPNNLGERFCKGLKAIALRDMLPEVSTWEELDTAIQAVSLMKLSDRLTLFAMTTREPMQEKGALPTPVAGELKTHTNVPMEDVICAVQVLNLGNTNLVSHVQQALYHTQVSTPRWTGPLLNAVRARPAAPIQMRLQPKQCMAIIRQNVLAPQLNTEEGRATYEKQKVDWHAKYTDNRPNEYWPYPLTPGTFPVASGECWKCGQHRHPELPTGQCPGPYVPVPENNWHALAGLVEGDVRRAASRAPVQLVGARGYGAEQQGQAVRQILYNGQWVLFIPGGSGVVDFVWEQGKE